jgi:Tfp pilus assembly protein PilN
MIRINLLGHEAAKPKRRSMPEFNVGGSDNAPFILAVVATVVLVAAAWWWQSRDFARLQVRHAQVTAEQQELADTAERVRTLEDRRAVVNQKLDVIVSLKKSQSGPVLLLDQISRELSDSVWLTDLSVTQDGEVTIVGQALSEIAIADFSQNLRLSSYFADTNPAFTQDTGDSVRFQLSTRFVPLTPPEEPAPVEEDAGAPGGRGGPARGR